MKKLLIGILIPVFVLALSMGVVGVANAEEDTDQVGLTMSQFEKLLELIEALQLQIDTADLQDKLVRQDLRDDVKEIRDFAMDMYEGMTSDEVSDLQELLSGYSDIYPEGIVSGYFGPLTRQAVKRFQKKLGIDDTGYVGPLTRRALNDLIDDGEISEEEASMMPAGIQKGYALGKPLPPGIYKNLKERRGFAKRYGWDDDDDDDDDSDDPEASEGEAKSAIDNAQDEIDEALELIENSDADAEVIDEAQELVDDAEAKLADAQEEFDDENYGQAKELAREAEEVAENAQELLEDEDDSSELEESAEEAIADAEEAIADAQSAIDASDDDDLITEAEELLGQAEDKLEEAETAFDAEDWEDAKNLADEAEDLAEEAEDLFED